MRRIRILVALLAVALAVPTALLVWRGLEGVAAEKAVRHRTVAERVFDEMERSLSRFLEAEEDRPWDDYRGERINGEQPGFVVGHFEEEPAGRVLVFGGGDAQMAERVQQVVVRDREARGREARPDEADALAQVRAQEPGTTTVTLSPIRLGQLRALGYVADAPVAEEEPAAEVSQQSGRAYDALQSLNRGAAERKERARKVVQEAPPQAQAHAQAEAEVQGAPSLPTAKRAARAPAPSRARLPAAQPALQQAADRVAGQAAGRAAASAEDRAGEGLAEAGEMARDEDAAFADEALEDAVASIKRELRPADAKPAPPIPESRPAPAPAPAPKATAEGFRQNRTTLRIAVDPLHGRAVDDSHLLLARTVWIGERGVRQGLVLDRVALADWLREGVFAPLALPGAQLSFGEAAEAPGAYGFRHRFAEPFQDVTASLGLAPLAGGRGEAPIYLLAVLLAVVGAAGLFAVYRSAAVTVGFAERRSNFVAAVTHELKTPLTSIRMYAEMLRDGIVADDGKRNEYYRTITAESERLGRLINNVLEFSRLEKGTREMNLVTGDLGAVVAEAAELVRPHAEAEGFALEVELEPGLPTVRFDRDAVFQVVFNLIDNAVKYAAEARERRIRVECRAAPEGGVELRVRDHGPGVPARHLAQVFEPFYRGEDELTRRRQGTGLGLALVKALADRMHAPLEGHNPEDGGFEIRIAFS